MFMHHCLDGLVCGALLAVISVQPAAGQAAKPVLGAAIQGGDALGPESAGRGEAVLFGRSEVAHGLEVGAELRGSLEGYLGGWGCGTEPSGTVPSVAVTCLRPAVGFHLLAGLSAPAGGRISVHAELGVGGAVLWLRPGRGGHTRRDTHLSVLGRASALVQVGHLLQGQWAIGPVVELRAVDLSDPRMAGSVGLVLEARVQ